MDENTKILIQTLLAETLRIYLKKCYEVNETPKEEIKNNIESAIKSLS